MIANINNSCMVLFFFSHFVSDFNVSDREVAVSVHIVLQYPGPCGGMPSLSVTRRGELEEPDRERGRESEGRHGPLKGERRKCCSEKERRVNYQGVLTRGTRGDTPDQLRSNHGA